MSNGEPAHLAIGTMQANRITIQKKKSRDYRFLADRFLFDESGEPRFTRLDTTGEQVSHFVYWAGAFWRYDTAKATHVQVEMDDLKLLVGNFLDRCDVSDGDGGVQPYETSESRLRNIIEAIRRRVGKQTMGDRLPPVFLGRDSIELDSCIAFKNSIVRTPRDSAFEEAIAKTPAVFTPTVLPYDFDPQAGEPVRFIRWLEDKFRHDPKQIDVIQEFMGLAMAGDSSIHRCLHVTGPPRSGKSTLLRVFSAVLGGHNVVGATLDDLTYTFGLESWISKSLAVFHDVKWSVRDSSKAVRTIKAISGQDGATVQRKNRGAWSGQLHTRLVFTSNDAMDLRDDSGGLASRMLCITMPNVHDGPEDSRIEARILEELSEIALWAMRGRVRVCQRGHFKETPQMLLEREAAREAGSPLVGFLRDCCDVIPGDEDRESAPWNFELYDAYRNDCCEKGISKIKDKPTFVRELKVAEPRISVQPYGAERRKKILGIRLKSHVLNNPANQL